MPGVHCIVSESYYRMLEKEKDVFTKKANLPKLSIRDFTEIKARQSKGIF